MHNSKFYFCSHCGNIVIKAHDSGAAISCCGEPMQEMKPNTTDAAEEKHVPAVTRNGNRISVEVGSVTHPMEEKHFIEWIYLVTEQGTYSRHLHPGDAPKAEFEVINDKPVAVYAYCNLHGLWTAGV